MVKMDEYVTVSVVTALASHANSPNTQGYWTHSWYTSKGMTEKARWQGSAAVTISTASHGIIEHSRDAVEHNQWPHKLGVGMTPGLMSLQSFLQPWY